MTLTDAQLKMLAGLEGMVEVHPGAWERPTGNTALLLSVMALRERYSTVDGLLGVLETKGWGHMLTHRLKGSDLHTASVWDVRPSPVYTHTADIAYAALLGAIEKAVGKEK